MAGQRVKRTRGEDRQTAPRPPPQQVGPSVAPTQPLTPFAFALVSLAAYRLALLSTDKLTLPARARLARRFPPEELDAGQFRPHPLVVLANCGRCLGVWTAALCTLAAHALGQAPSWGACALAWPAAAGAVALLVRVEP